MAVVGTKLSKIANSPSNAGASDKFVGVNGEATDYQYTTSQIFGGLALTGDVTSTGQVTTLATTQPSAHTWRATQTITPSAANTNPLTLNLGSLTSSTSGLNVTATWNNSGVVFGGLIFANVVNTASAGGSKLLQLQSGGSDVLTFTLSGGLSVSQNSGTVAAGTYIGSNVAGSFRNNAGNSFFGFVASATAQLGSADAASPVAQALRAQGSRAGTDSNVGGANLTIFPGTGTGTGALSTLNLQSPVAVASGTGAQTQTTGLTIKAGAAVLTNYAVAALPNAATVGSGGRAFVTDANTTIILGLGLAVVGGGANKVPVYSDGTNWIVG